MRGHTTGYGIPQFVIDGPRGGGKIPLNPNYIKEINENELVLKNFRGDEFKYPLYPSQSGSDPEFTSKSENPLSVVRYS